MWCFYTVHLVRCFINIQLYTYITIYITFTISSLGNKREWWSNGVWDFYLLKVIHTRFDPLSFFSKISGYFQSVFLQPVTYLRWWLLQISFDLFLINLRTFLETLMLSLFFSCTLTMLRHFSVDILCLNEAFCWCVHDKPVMYCLFRSPWRYAVL